MGKSPTRAHAQNCTHPHVFHLLRRHPPFSRHQFHQCHQRYLCHGILHLWPIIGTLRFRSVHAAWRARPPCALGVHCQSHHLRFARPLRAPLMGLQVWLRTPNAQWLIDIRGSTPLPNPQSCATLHYIENSQDNHKNFGLIRLFLTAQ